MKYSNTNWKPNDPRAIFCRGAMALRNVLALSCEDMTAVMEMAEKLFPNGKVPNRECPHCHHEHLYKGWGKSCGVLQHLKPGEGTSPWGTCPCVEGQGWE